VFCLAQSRSCLVEILALVNEVCAASPSNPDGRELHHEDALSLL